MPPNLGSQYFELPAVQKHYCRQESKHSIFSPTLWHDGIQCSIPSKVCSLRKRLPLSCHKNSSQIHVFDVTKLWKHTIPLTYNTKSLKGLAMIFAGQENPFIIFRSKKIYIYFKTNNRIPIIFAEIMKKNSVFGISFLRAL